MNTNIILFIVVYGIEMLISNGVVAGTCEDTHKDCAKLVKFEWCTKRASLMKRICESTCDMCGKEVTVPPKNQPRHKISLNTCKNYNAECSVFKEAGWCEKKKSTMLKLCGPTCGFCKDGEEMVVHVTIATTTTTTVAMIKPEDCKDIRPDCNRLRNEKGWCVSREKNYLMKKLCPKTCNFCPTTIVQPQKTLPKKEITKAPPTVTSEKKVPICADRMKGCSFMFTRGWCTHRKDQMEDRCRKTCGFCDACSDTREECFQYKTFGWCESKKDEMVNVCARTCNLCNNVPTAVKPIAKVCKDARKTCFKMKKLGFCSSRQAVMTKLCPATCGFCPDSKNNENPNKLTTTQPPATTARVPGCKDDYGRERCEYYAHIGWCEKHDRIKKNCHDTCVCNYKKPKGHGNQKCEDTTLGCCWDKKTTKRDVKGKNCPTCSDDARFVVLCGRFGDDCTGSGSLAKSLHKYCPKTCKSCKS